MYRGGLPVNHPKRKPEKWERSQSHMCTAVKRSARGGCLHTDHLSEVTFAKYNPVVLSSGGCQGERKAGKKGLMSALVS